MSESSSNGASGGLGFTGALSLLFIGLKLGHVIDWAWLWVLSPLWIGAAFVVFCLIVMGVVAGVVAFLGSRT